MTQPIHVIGGGLAGSEAAWQIARAGVPVVLHEMRPVKPTLVHKSDGLAELVCSNSFRGDKLDNAVGLLKEEMRRFFIRNGAERDARLGPELHLFFFNVKKERKKKVSGVIGCKRERKKEFF